MYSKIKLVLYQDFQDACKCITQYQVLCTFALRVLYIYFCIMLLFLPVRCSSTDSRTDWISEVRVYIKGSRLLQRSEVTSKVKGYLKG